MGSGEQNDKDTTGPNCIGADFCRCCVCALRSPVAAARLRERTDRAESGTVTVFAAQSAAFMPHPAASVPHSGRHCRAVLII
jgi:hypothetical protein